MKKLLVFLFIIAIILIMVVIYLPEEQADVSFKQIECDSIDLKLSTFNEKTNSLISVPIDIYSPAGYVKTVHTSNEGKIDISTGVKCSKGVTLLVGLDSFYYFEKVIIHSSGDLKIPMRELGKLNMTFHNTTVGTSNNVTVNLGSGVCAVDFSMELNTSYRQFYGANNSIVFCFNYSNSSYDNTVKFLIKDTIDYKKVHDDYSHCLLFQSEKPLTFQDNINIPMSVCSNSEVDPSNLNVTIRAYDYANYKQNGDISYDALREVSGNLFELMGTDLLMEDAVIIG